MSGMPVCSSGLCNPVCNPAVTPLFADSPFLTFVCAVRSFAVKRLMRLYSETGFRLSCTFCSAKVAFLGLRFSLRYELVIHTNRGASLIQRSVPGPWFSALVWVVYPLGLV